MKTCIILSKNSIENLHKISELICEDKKSRIIATSLEITKEILSRIDKNKSLIVRDKSGNEQELIFVKR